MSDLTSLRAILKLELNTNTGYLDIAIADALRHVRHERLWFNGGKFEFVTSENRYEYPLPADFLGLRGRVYCTPSSSTTSGRYPLKSATTDEVETFLYTGVDYGSYEARGFAKKAAIDMNGRAILISPIPDPGGDAIFFRYTRDLGTPVYTVSTTSSAPPSLSETVTLLSPTGGTLESTFTNDWFKEGFKLVKERALYEMYSRFYGGTKESTINAQGALLRYLEELKRLRGETAQVGAGLTIRKHF